MIYNIKIIKTIQNIKIIKIIKIMTKISEENHVSSLQRGERRRKSCSRISEMCRSLPEEKELSTLHWQGKRS